MLCKVHISGKDGAMKMQRNHAKVGIGAGAILALLGLSLVAFAGDLQIGRPPMPRAGGASAGAPSVASGPATAIYLKVVGIDGEVTEKEHAGWSHALSFSQILIAPQDAPTGQVAGRFAARNIVVTKPLDKVGPKLAQALSQNAVQKKVFIDVTRSSPAGNRAFFAYELTNAVVVNYEVSGATSPQGFPIEEISFGFEEVKVTYTEFDAKGGARSPVTYSYRRQ
jgi:type VI secretion system Hcp family effector